MAITRGGQVFLKLQPFVDVMADCSKRQIAREVAKIKRYKSDKAA
jgi:hypothetical protein